MRTTVRFWRWRGNTLRRRSDRIEAWVVLVAGILLWLGAPLVGALAGLAMAQHAPRPGADWHQVTAVLVKTAPSAPATGWTSTTATDARVGAEVRWTAADGTTRTGLAMVPPETPAGRQVPVWLDGAGTLRADPGDPAQAQARAVVFGLMAGTVSCLVVLGTQCAAVGALNRRRAAALDREWEQVGPNWGHHPA
jgi:hypothetical protein